MAELPEWLLAIGFILVGMLGLAVLVAPILVPLLYRTRLVVRLRVTTTDGSPLAGLPIGGVRNRTGAAFQATGEGMLTGAQLHAVRDRLGVTDAEGRFERTYYLRNFHTLWLGETELFLSPNLTEKMRHRPHELSLNERSPGGPL